MSAPAQVTIRRPDDWHLHLRDGAMLRRVVGHSAACFARAIVMPNLVPPVTTTALAVAYRERIRQALPAGASFEPLMTVYLTDDTDADDLARGHGDGAITAVKLYPAHATTHSEHGVTDIAGVYPVLAAMERGGLPLLVHGEVADPEIDVFDREAVFIERVLRPIVADFPALKIVLEHATTEDAVSFVREAGETVAATITPHHLMINRNALFAGGLRPHMYCLPVAKRERHRVALRGAAISGEASFFLGTDSAPHPIADKESGCGCAGIFNAPVALECYAQVFAEEDALHRLEAFASENGARFYGLALNHGEITLKRGDYRVAEAASGPVVQYRAGEILNWAVEPAGAER